MPPPSSNTTSNAPKRANAPIPSVPRLIRTATPDWRDILDALATIALLTATLPLLLALSLIPRRHRDWQR